MDHVEELIKAHGKPEKEVYLDFENSSPVPEEVIEAMLPYFNRVAYGNPTLTHKPGWEAYEAIWKSAEKIAGYIGCEEPEEVNFIPGETEANNLALMGVAFKQRKNGRKIIISEIEPLSVLHVCRILEKYGFTTVKVPVDKDGVINLEKLKELVDREVLLASFMMVNNEIGTIEPVREAVEIVRDKCPEAVVHTDACDAYGRVKFDVDRLGVDLATISSYKILGPRGVAALYVRSGVSIEKILEGQFGTQKLWPGVENTPLIVGFAVASENAFTNFDGNVAHMRRLRDKLIDGILNNVDEVILNGPFGDKRAPDNINISFLKCEGESLTVELSLRGVYVSSGSACSRRILQPSHVLVAIGRKFEEAHGSILMKVTRYHTDEDVEYVVQAVCESVKRLRKVYGNMGG